MKIILLSLTLIACNFLHVQSQDTWTKKADFGGIGRYGAVGFSIGEKGYLGTGRDNNLNFRRDFWEYDPSTDAWTQKADFGGTPRYGAVGFSIGTKGYIGTGLGDYYIHKRDFWEYDPSTNIWTKIANYAGGVMGAAVGFSIGNKGYMGTGAYVVYRNDFWEYDPSLDVWTQKADVGGTGRAGAVGFSIGNKGYIGTGYNYTFLKDSFLRDFWEYDPAIDAWAQKASFEGKGRDAAVAFSINNKGYIGTGYDGNKLRKDFWEYEPLKNSWTKKNNFPGPARDDAVGFSIGNKGYIGTGVFDGKSKDFWEYTPDKVSCSVPYNGFTSDITSTSATVNWNDSSNTATGYRIYYKEKNTSSWNKAHSKGDSLSKTLKGLTPNTTYVWQVAANCDSTHSDFSPHYEFSTLSEKESDIKAPSADFSVLPNPAKDIITVTKTFNNEESISIQILDLVGKVLYSENEGSISGSFYKQFDLVNFSSGTYLLQFIHNGQAEVKKLVIEN